MRFNSYKSVKKSGKPRSPITEHDIQLYKSTKPDMLKTQISKVGSITSFLGSISAARSQDPLIASSSKIGLGLSLTSDKVRSILGIKDATGGAALSLGAIGGGLAIAGISQLATSSMSSFASIPTSALTGYLIGSKSFTPLLGSSANPIAGGIIGAGVGLGFGIHSLITSRNARRKEKQRQARAIDTQNREFQAQYEAFSSLLPMMDDEEKMLQKQIDQNFDILNFNIKESQRVNSLNNPNIKKLASNSLGKLKLDLASAGISYQGAGWFLAGEIQDQEAKLLQESNHELAVNLQRIDFQKSSLRHQAAAAFRDIFYTRKSVEAEIDYSKRILERNLSALRSNRYSSSGQVKRARTALAASGALSSTLNTQASSAEKSYYNVSNYY